MKDLRERCTELRNLIDRYSAPIDKQRFIESFAREIRNETIEEIATMVEYRYDFLGGEIEVALHIRQKTDALAAKEK